MMQHSGSHEFLNHNQAFLILIRIAQMLLLRR